MKKGVTGSGAPPTTVPGSNWLDRVVSYLSPTAGARRARARYVEHELRSLSLRRFEGAGRGRRTAGWIAHETSANAEAWGALATLRARSRDLVRNNSYAKKAVESIEGDAVGVGILLELKARGTRQGRAGKATDIWRLWAETLDCDADGLNDFYGLQALIMRTLVESGEVLIRRRYVSSTLGLAVPLQIQVMEPDHIDTLRNEELANGNRIIQGVEFDASNRRVAYWLFPFHPGDQSILLRTAYVSQRVEAADVIHLFRVDRAGQVRGIPWGASCILRLRDYDEYEDAQLVRQKIAACFTAFVHDMEMPENGLPPVMHGRPGQPAGVPRDEYDLLEPGLVQTLPQGKSVTFAAPPGVEGYADYSTITLRAVAAGYGVTYEALTGDYSRVNFSSGRLGFLASQRQIDKWRWHLIIPRVCNRVFAWFREAALISHGVRMDDLVPTWTPPRREMIDPTREVPAIRAGIRAGLLTQSEAIRQNGYDPDSVFAEMAEDNARLDELGLILDSDPRKIAGAGQIQIDPATAGAAAASAKDGENGKTDDSSSDDETETEAEGTAGGKNAES